MKYLLGWAASLGMAVTAAAAQAQSLPPMKSDLPPFVHISDVGGPYAAMPPSYGDGYARLAPPILPPREIYAILRESGFSPLGAPRQRGLVYTVSAIDRDGEDGRMVIDARSGRILRFMPAWRMGDRMGDEMVTRYGPAGPPLELPQYRRAPPLPVPLPRIANRTPGVPLPKAPPVRAVARPAKPVVAPVTVAVPPAPPAAAAAPAEQSAVVTPKPGEVRVIPLTAAPAAPPADAKPTETRPIETKPAETAAPAVQGLE